MHGSCPARMVALIACRSMTALCNFAFGILLGGGDMELKFFVTSLIVFEVSFGSWWPIRLARDHMVSHLGRDRWDVG